MNLTPNMSNYISYSEKLVDDRWHKKKTEILRRDKFKCRLCGASDNLNVHHRYYIYHADPWQYPNSALITLCQSCHELVHATLAPLVYVNTSEHLFRMMFTPCIRCNGYGYFSEYKHIQNGVCFRCRGERYEELTGRAIKIESYLDTSAEIFDNLSINNNAENLFLRGNRLYSCKPEKAKLLYYEAAISNFAKAQNNLGLLLQEQGDIESAKRWFLYAAMQGISQGVRNLGLLLRDEGNHKILKKWLPILRKDKHFICGIAFEKFIEYYDSKGVKPSMHVLLSSIDTLVRLAKERFKPAIEIVEEYKIIAIQESLMNHLKKHSNNKSSCNCLKVVEGSQTVFSKEDLKKITCCILLPSENVDDNKNSLDLVIEASVNKKSKCFRVKLDDVSFNRYHDQCNKHIDPSKVCIYQLYDPNKKFRNEKSLHSNAWQVCRIKKNALINST